MTGPATPKQAASIFAVVLLDAAVPVSVVPLPGCKFVYGRWGLRWNKKFREHVLERGVIGTVE